MSNLYTLQQPSAHTHGKFTNSILNFEVEERRLYHGGKVEDQAFVQDKTTPIHRHKALVHKQTGKTLAIVGKNYKTVQNSVLFPAIEEQLNKTLSHDEERGMINYDSVSYDGRVCIRDTQFPSMLCRVGDSDVGFRIITKTGFGGSSLQMYFGAISFFCMNGWVSGEFDVMYARHTSGFSITNIQEKVRQNIDIYYRQADIWRKWVKVEITRERAEEFFLKLVDAGTISERRTKQLMRQYEIETLTHGRTVWALYNALTYFSSHTEGEFKVRDTGENHQSVTLLNRGREVRKWVSSVEWNELSKAA